MVDVKEKRERGLLEQVGSESSLVRKVAYNAKTLVACSSSDARQLLAFEDATRLNALPLGLVRTYDSSALTLAVEDEGNIELKRALRFVVGADVSLVAVPREILTEAIFRAYNSDEKRLASKITAIGENPSELSKVRRGPEMVAFRNVGGNAAQLLESLVDYCISVSASDLHIVPRAEGTFVKIRVAGDLRTHQQPLSSKDLHERLINRIKVLAGLDCAQRYLPQDGAFEVPIATRNVHVRVSVMPTVHGEKAVLRLIGCDGLLQLSELGLCEITEAALLGALAKQSGAIIFAGPTGSGKTTTMYAALDRLSKRNLNCVTLEDPVEMFLPGVTQTAVDYKRGLDFACGLRSILRQDPDVIMVGEIRDSDSASMAIQASLTGHLLLTSVHARDVSEVLLRLRELGVGELNIAQSLSLIVCQRLVPRLCGECKVIDLMSTHRFEGEIFREVGCSRCDYSGYSGQNLATESLEISRDIAKGIANGGFEALLRADLDGVETYASLKGALFEILKKGEMSIKQFTSMIKE